MGRKKAVEKEEVDTALEDKILKIKQYITQYNKDNPSVVLGMAEDLDLDYGFIEPPILPLARLLARDGEATGGFPRGKFTSIAGPERSGKTTLLLQTISADMAKNINDYYVWVDTENTFDEPYARKLGIDFKRLIIIKNGIMEDILDRIVELSKLGVVAAVVIDSVGGLTPRQELYDSKGNEQSVAATHMLDLQRKIGQFFRMANPFVAKANCAIILICHVYQDPSSQGAYKVKGGNALKHWAHIRLMMNRMNDQATKETITMPDGEKREVMLGHDVIIKLDKTRQNSKENQSVVIPFRPGIGLDSFESVISIGINLGMIERAGAWYKYGNNKMQGRTEVLNWFKENSDNYQKLVGDILAGSLDKSPGDNK